MKVCTECPSGSALALVLRMSRLAGVAPVSFSAGVLHISRPLAFYSYFLVTAISFIVLSGFALDLLTEPRRSLRVSTPTSRVIWVANLTIVMLITCVATYRAPARTTCMIDCLNQVKQIKKFLNKEANSSSSEKFQILMVVLSCLGLWFLIFLDIYGYVIEVITYDLEVRTLLLYSFFYYEYFLVLLVMLQFLLTALKLLSALQLVNDSLNQMILANNTDGNRHHSIFFVHDELKSVFKSKINNYTSKASPKTSKFVIPPSSVRQCIDSKLAYHGKIRTVRDLCKAYGEFCDILRYMDEGHGLVLLLILASFFFQLIITPYYLITCIYTSTIRISNILLQVCWCIYHLLSMCMVVEPCYQMQKEIEKTQVLVGYLMRNVSPTDPVFVDLDIFCRQLHEDIPTYTPLGMCTLSRPLIVRIIGAVTTYLVIIFQFRTYESSSSSDGT